MCRPSCLRKTSQSTTFLLCLFHLAPQQLQNWDILKSISLKNLRTSTTSAIQVNYSLPPPAIVTALKQHVKHGPITSILCPHLPAAGGAHYPLWIIEFWTKLLRARCVQESWTKAAHQLDARLQTSPNNHLLQRAANALSHLPWTGDLRGYQNIIDTSHLSVYFTQEWLTDEHLLLMLELLEEDLSRKFQEHVFIENTHFATLLTAAYHDRERYATERSYNWIRNRGEQLANGDKTYLATVVNQDNVHWVALVIDFDKKKIQYGDSAGHPIEPAFRNVIEWWAFYHTGVHFTDVELVTSLQCDSFSCGMLAWDALRYQLSDLSTTRMDPSQPFHERLKVFLRLVKHYSNGQVSRKF